jgi:hypothetical protein
MIEKSLAIQIIEQLRRGLPPQRGTRHYAVGHEKLLAGIRKFHLNGIADKGIIRFVSGSWGAGKTHFFRLMREEAFEAGCLVANVELNVKEAPLSKFEKVFHSIIRNVVTPSYFRGNAPASAAPFGTVLREALVYLSTGEHGEPREISHDDYTRASEKLMGCSAIDIDFRKVVQKFWETFLPEAPDPALIDQKRDEILQWFSGEGAIGQWRKAIGVNKLVSKENSKLMLQSLAAFVQLVGYKGLVILFDETEMSYSVMRKSQLKEAHNNLLHLLNNISDLTGLFLLYATTPDFYDDPKHGIVIYGALSGRIGKPGDHPPKPFENVWNLDAIDFTLAEYQESARKIREIHATAYPEGAADLPDEKKLDALVAELYAMHPSLSQVRFWRVLITGTVRILDDAMQGEEIVTPNTYHDVMADLRES